MVLDVLIGASGLFLLAAVYLALAPGDRETDACGSCGPEEDPTLCGGCGLSERAGGRRGEGAPPPRGRRAGGDGWLPPTRFGLPSPPGEATRERTWWREERR